jgi:hypothetical protein
MIDEAADAGFRLCFGDVPRFDFSHGALPDSIMWTMLGQPLRRRHHAVQ